MKDKNTPIVAKYRLKERNPDGKFGPLLVSNKSHPALVRIIEAFDNSGEVSLGYATIQKGKGIVEPTMKRKDLYLCGESVRDHLANQGVEHYQCVTNASPDEIKKILKSPQGKFKEVRPNVSDPQILSKYKEFPSSEDHKYCFYPSRWDHDMQEVEITAVVNGQKVHISPFSLHEKNRLILPVKARFTTSVELDSMARDVSINSMYIKLKESDGENGELIDPQGGMHDLRAGVVRLVRKPSLLFQKNPYLPFILCNMGARFGNEGKLSKDLIDDILEFKFDDYDSSVLRRLFNSAIENSDVPISKYLKNLKETQLLGKIFPRLRFIDPCGVMDCTLIPNNKVIALALTLLGNDPNQVQDILKSRGFSALDAENVAFLVRLHRLLDSGHLNPQTMQQLFDRPVNLSKNMIKHFMHLIGTPDQLVKIVDLKLV